MNKTSNPELKDGLGIVARLLVIAMLLGVLSTVLQGCSSTQESSAIEVGRFDLPVSAEELSDNGYLVLL